MNPLVITYPRRWILTVRLPQNLGAMLVPLLVWDILQHRIPWIWELSLLALGVVSMLPSLLMFTVLSPEGVRTGMWPGRGRFTPWTDVLSVGEIGNERKRSVTYRLPDGRRKTMPGLSWHRSAVNPSYFENRDRALAYCTALGPKSEADAGSGPAGYSPDTGAPVSSVDALGAPETETSAPS